MSNMFVGIFVQRPAPEVKQYLSTDSFIGLLGVASFSDGLTAVFDNSPRSKPIADSEVERLARKLSTNFSRGLLIDYNDQVGYRSAKIYENGECVKEFDADDELWIPLSENGEPNLKASPVRSSEFLEDEEYETVKDALDLGFEAFGAGSWSALVDFFGKGGLDY